MCHTVTKADGGPERERAGPRVDRDQGARRWSAPCSRCSAAGGPAVPAVLHRRQARRRHNRGHVPSTSWRARAHRRYIIETLAARSGCRHYADEPRAPEFPSILTVMSCIRNKDIMV
ncbi:hypothetical protein HU200_010824 [Digitaria exilis]|uniref:Uncharacterized protein n=1 Tax=Digitaria exilis TaxID=1010633 RepID=A0A835KLX1_9POAL|nr:hypothetical protein HU200_010824 [Digitaria exilis]